MGKSTKIDEVAHFQAPPFEGFELEKRERILARLPGTVDVHHPCAVEELKTGLTLERPRNGLQPERLHHVVVVEVTHDLPGGCRQARVAGGARTTVGLRDDNDPIVLGREAGQQRRRLVRTSVVDNHELPVGVLLCAHRIHCPAKEFASVVRRHQHGYPRSRA